MAHLIPLSRLARLVGQSRSVLQRMAQDGELATFDGQVELDEVLRHFPDVRLDDEQEIRRVEEIKDQALRKAPLRPELPDAVVLYERLRILGRDFAKARGRLRHHERVHGWIAGKLAEAVETRQASPQFAEQFLSWFKRELAAPQADIRSWEDLLAMERVMQVMSAQVTVVPSGQSFEVMGDETLLEAGLRAGLSLPYGCSNGTCGQCKCRVVNGDVVKVRPHDFVFSAADKNDGFTLTCAYTAVGDVELEVPLWGVADIPEQTIVTRVRAIETLGPTRIALHLLTPRAERLRYLAGQQIEITIAGESRLVPAAGCPCEERRIEVHVLCDRDEAFDRGILAGLAANDEVTIRGPFGDFVLDDGSERSVLLIAKGPGFAPVKSLLQHALSLERAPQITLHRIAGAEGLYQENLLKSYAGALDHFHYIAHPAAETDTAVLDQIVRDAERAGIAELDVYAAGDEGFVTGLRAALTRCGLPAGRFKGMAID